MSDITDKQIYRAVSNYLSNTLGYNQTRVEQILQEKIDSCNPGAMVEKTVAKYFRTSPGRNYNTDMMVRAEIGKIIKEYIQEKLKKGGTESLNARIQDAMDDICWNTLKPINDFIMSKSGIEVYPVAIVISWTALNKIAEDWTKMLQFETDTEITLVAPKTKDLILMNINEWGELMNKPNSLCELLSPEDIRFMKMGLTNISLQDRHLGYRLPENIKNRILEKELDNNILIKSTAAAHEGLICLCCYPSK